MSWRGKKEKNRQTERDKEKILETGLGIKVTGTCAYQKPGSQAQGLLALPLTPVLQVCIEEVRC